MTMMNAAIALFWKLDHFVVNHILVFLTDVGIT